VANSIGYIKTRDGRPLVLPAYDTREQRDQWVVLEIRPGGMVVAAEVDPGVAAMADLQANGGAGDEPEQPFLPHDTRGPLGEKRFSTDGTDVIAADETHRGSDQLMNASPPVVEALTSEAKHKPEAEQESVATQVAGDESATHSSSALTDEAHALGDHGQVEPVPAVPVQAADEV
jgi:hypothetical protein